MMKHGTRILLPALALGLLTVLSAHAADQNDPPLQENFSLENRLLGYWAPDVERMEKILKKEMGEEQDPFLPLVMKIVKAMTLEIEREAIVIHGLPDADKKSTYKVKNANPFTKTLTLDIKDPDAEAPTVSTAKFEGEQLVLTRDDEPPLVLNRIDAAGFKKRQENAKEFLEELEFDLEFE